ncbi:hypothetical protein QBC43DRAFT_351755 [Cladorrhinum sp. PSN259]|nr:hypothetical protein QBC43DRAFT_351755 [Cladorrhinum sp. PSN259]
MDVPGFLLTIVLISAILFQFFLLFETSFRHATRVTKSLLSLARRWFYSLVPIIVICSSLFYYLIFALHHPPPPPPPSSSYSLADRTQDQTPSYSSPPTELPNEVGLPAPPSDGLSRSKYFFLCFFFTLPYLLATNEFDLLHIVRFWLTYPFRYLPLLGPYLGGRNDALPAALTGPSWKFDPNESTFSRTCRYFRRSPEKTATYVGVGFCGLVMNMLLVSFCQCVRGFTLSVASWVWFFTCWYGYFAVLALVCLALVNLGKVFWGTVWWFTGGVLAGLEEWVKTTRSLFFIFTVISVLLFWDRLFNFENWCRLVSSGLHGFFMIVAEFFYWCGDTVMNIFSPRCPNFREACEATWRYYSD